MRLGLTVPAFRWPGGPARIGPILGRIARDADTHGLASLWLMDHYFQVTINGRAEDPMLDGYAALSFAAALTSDISLGTLCTGVTYRHPGLLGKLVTTLDVLSGGRAYLGIGAAWYREEHDGLGVTFPPMAERFERLEETLQITGRMFANDDSPYIGTHYRLARPLNSPPPLGRVDTARPHPPILVGGTGERKTLRLVAQYADACNLYDAPDLPHKLAVLREHCDRLGRPYEEIEKTVLSQFKLKDDPRTDPAASVAHLERLAALGIDHVIVSLPAVHNENAVISLGKVAAEVADLVPAGR
ncbi:LLM class F420-dependent oxidoreductase [Wenjunlia tyrosinilytica]|uniref:LLM class F420-dependent oxidoreductase n=1 Tax=Wenjunlia tyrosinilytica TaxID=1544741 RepID=A0A917ZXQ5_9ACTN|nr:LLM class F420-dependent oxidoreductase [Wenjunlia tyrosinilytica]GGO96039.1 LLM class F420-dependent oxidoreductase [Wenjunlia tyrosinilytica]